MIGALSTKISYLSAAPEEGVDSVIGKEVEVSPCRAAAFLQPAGELTVELRPVPGAVTSWRFGLCRSRLWLEAPIGRYAESYLLIAQEGEREGI